MININTILNEYPDSSLFIKDGTYVKVIPNDAISIDDCFILSFKNENVEKKYFIEAVMDWGLNLNDGWTIL